MINTIEHSTSANSLGNRSTIRMQESGDKTRLRFLVTGATGFIGAHLCKRLLDDGHIVFALVRDKTKAGKVLPSHQGLRLIEGDLSIFSKEDVVLPRCDVVVHLAAVITAKNSQEYHKTNCNAVRDMISCLDRQSWKPLLYLFASSLAAAGPCSLSAPLTETCKPSPIDPYGKAKAEAEILVREASFPTTSFRPPIVLGSGDPNFLTVFRMAKFRIGARIGNQKLSWIDVRDLIEAIILMIQDGTQKTNTSQNKNHNKNKTKNTDNNLNEREQLKQSGTKQDEDNEGTEEDNTLIIKHEKNEKGREDSDDNDKDNEDKNLTQSSVVDTKHKLYFVSAETDIDTKTLWKELSIVFGHYILVFPIPKWIIFLLMLFLTVVAWLVPCVNNQLDYKQYKQVTASAFLCSSKKFQRELGWKPRYALRDSLAAADRKSVV